MSAKAFDFSLGDPEPMLGNHLSEFLGTFLVETEDYYTTPLSLKGLVDISKANPHHATALQFKRNLATKYFIESPVLSKRDFRRWAYDFFLFGHNYLQVIRNRLGGIVRLKHLRALPMRKHKDKNRFCWLNQGKAIPFKPGEVIALTNYDPSQPYYGLPDYFAVIQSVLLNEDSTLFRRRYYKNGAHLGYILYTADADFKEEDEALLKKKVQESKGVGNFRSMFLNVPGGKPDSVKIIPVGDIATKDEFDRIKNITRNDVIAMHRIHPALAGIMPENTTGFGDIEKISRIQYENEIIPMQDIFLEINEYLPSQRKITFREPDS